MILAEAEELARALVAEHLGGTGFSFAFDQAHRRFGCCRWDKRLITLSAPLTRSNDRPQVLNTILHEIAHALAGHDAGHGPSWRRIAVALGSDGKRCYSLAEVAPAKRRVTSFADLLDAPPSTR